MQKSSDKGALSHHVEELRIFRRLALFINVVDTVVSILIKRIPLWQCAFKLKNLILINLVQNL